jgi:hypothetical protein
MQLRYFFTLFDIAECLRTLNVTFGFGAFIELSPGVFFLFGPLLHKDLILLIHHLTRFLLEILERLGVLWIIREEHGAFQTRRLNSLSSQSFK